MTEAQALGFVVFACIGAIAGVVIAVSDHEPGEPFPWGVMLMAMLLFASLSGSLGMCASGPGR